VLTALAEGLDISAAEQVFGYQQTTITSLSVSRFSLVMASMCIATRFPA